MYLNVLKDVGGENYGLNTQNLLNFVGLRTDFVMETVFITTLYHPEEFGV